MSTTLNGAIISSDTTITVVSTSGFTTSGIILINNEEVSYTAINGTQFTSCTRGFDTTVAAGHNSGATVSQVIASTPFTGEVPTIANPADATTRKSYTADAISFPTSVKGRIRLVASGVIVPGKNAAASTGKGGGAFASNALDYTMRGFHVQLNQFVSWKAPFADSTASQYFGNGGTPGTINNIVVLSRK